MFKIYILSSITHTKTYVGYTANLEQRLKNHNSGRVRATKLFRPWRIIHTEDANSKTEAKKKEKYWKSGAGRRNIKKLFRVPAR